MGIESRSGRSPKLANFGREAGSRVFVSDGEQKTRDQIFHTIKHAWVAKLVDARDLKSLDGNIMWVRFPPQAQ